MASYELISGNGQTCWANSHLRLCWDTDGTHDSIRDWAFKDATSLLDQEGGQQPQLASTETHNWLSLTLQAAEDGLNSLIDEKW